MTAFLDLADPSFSATGPEVRAAREQDWWARTGYGIAVLRYAEVRALLADRRLAQGSAKWPAHNGVDAARSWSGGRARCSTSRATRTTGCGGCSCRRSRRGT